MNKKQENKIGMFNTVFTMVGSHSGDSNLPPALLQGNNDLKEKIREIQLKDQEKSVVTGGKTMVKNQAGKKLINQIMMIAGPLTAWAAVNNNPEIKSIAGMSRSHLLRLRDNELAQVAAQIYKAANKLISSLTDYGVTAEHVDVLQKLNAIYRSAMGEQESSMANRVSAGASLNTLFQEADEIIKLRMDPLMETVKPLNLDFFQAYKAARVIKDLRGGTKRKTTMNG